MRRSGRRLEQIFLLLTLRITRGIMFAIYVASGYSLPKLQLTILLQEAEHQLYDMYSPTWPSAVRRAMRPKAQRVLSSNRKKK